MSVWIVDSGRCELIERLIRHVSHNADDLAKRILFFHPKADSLIERIAGSQILTNKSLANNKTMRRAFDVVGSREIPAADERDAHGPEVTR
jgi:hypothetical protein